MKKLYLLLILAFCHAQLFSQHQAVSFTLSYPIAGTGHHYKASEFIDMIPGFEYEAHSPGIDFIAEIDPFLIVPPAAGITGGPNPGDNGVVGALPAVVNVTELGAATYSIPLQLPPGIGNMAPQLAITYNSMMGNGLLGWGWTISGLSAISRTGSTIYHDNKVRGISFDEEDNLMLDGNRLIPVNEAGTEFRTEIESFSKIVQQQSNSYGPLWFEVRTKDGGILQFGNSTNSRHKLHGKQEVLSWYLNRIEDVKGNHIDFEYFQHNGEFRLNKVRYGGNCKTGQSHIYEIQLHVLAGRNDENKVFLSGGSMEMSVILGAISVKHLATDDFIYIYDLQYDWSGFYTRVKKINLIDGEGKSLNPTTFFWGEETEQCVQQDVNIEESDYKYVFGDYNGNGLTDYVRIPKDISNPANNFFELFLNNGNGSFSSSPDFTHSFPGGELSVLEGYQPANFRSMHDINGDGLGDLIFDAVIWQNFNEPPLIPAFYRFLYIFFSDGEGFELTTYPIMIDGPHLTDSIKSIEFGDFTGNGKTDIFLLRGSGDVHSWAIYYHDPDLSFFQSFWGLQNEYFKNAYAADFTNDQKSNIVLSNNSGSKIFEIVKDGEINILVRVNTDQSFPPSTLDVYYGDFNGDGIMDLLAWNESTESWSLYFFNGKAFVENNSILPNLLDPKYSIYVADFNGDGKADIMQVKTILDNSSLKVFYCNGVNFYQEYQGVINTVHHSPKYSGIGDFNGDGNSDIIFYAQSINVFKKILYFTPFDNSNIIESISDGFGREVAFEYSHLTNSEIYNKGNNAQFPLVDIQPPLRVVTAEKHSSGESLIETQNYKYANAIAHKTGKGFMGFGERIVEDNISLIRTKFYKEIYKPNGKFFFPYISTIKSYRIPEGPGGGKLSEANNILNHKTNPNSTFIFFPYVENSISHKYEYNTFDHLVTTRSFNSYDNFGNLTHSREVAHPDFMPPGAPNAAFQHQNDIHTIYYPPDLDNWIVGHPQKVTSEQRFKWSDPIIKSSKEFVYYQSNDDHFPFIKEVLNIPNDDSNDVLLTKEEYNYDDYGNVINTYYSAPNMPDLPVRETATTYSPGYHHRFPDNISNPAGNITSNVYNSIYGWLTSSTDFNELTTDFTHHPLGISSGTDFSDGNRQLNVLRWINNHIHAPDHNGGALYYAWSKESGQAEVLTFYNRIGQKLRTVSYGFDGNPKYIDWHYYQNGRLHMESFPYFPDDAIHYTQYYYDNIGRLVITLYPDKTFTSKAYSGNTISTTNYLQQTTKQMYNAVGWLVESEDAMGNKVNYDYFSDGKLKSSIIVGQLQTTVSLKYNSRRQRSELKDPNYGTATYEYNPFGELIEQVSPKNEISSYTYDILGRMLTRSEPEGTTQWIYDEEPERIGTLKSVQNSLHQTSYAYDDFLRLTSAVKTIEGNDYQTSYTYDVFGRMNTTTHPSGFAVKNVYQYGYRTQIRSAQNNALLWQTDEVNAMGQITDFQTGNGLLTSRIFEPETQRITTVNTYKTGQNPVQGLGYLWYETGNLKQRSSNIHNLYEFFTYDDLNRLETIRLNGTIRGEHHYDLTGLGNLIYKKADGQILFNNADYGENNAGPHALTSAETSAGIFSPEQQVIGYNSYDKVVSINEGSKQLQITYGHHRQRITQQYTEASNTIDKLWAGACEYITENGQQKTLTYISGPEGVFALHVINHHTSEHYIRYIHKDHLGSWNTITDENGNLLQELSFDAWGNRRNPATWRSFTGTPPAPLFDRGFTGHEHLFGFGLVNMNGRIYDPLVSRMLSPDNFIQSPGFSQSFNRYSYCFNNPLTYVDPSGEIVWMPILIAAGFGAYNGGVMANEGQYNPLEWDYSSGQTWGYMLGGAVVGGVSGYTGGAIAGTKVPFSNTLGLAGASLINSIGTNIYTDGKTDITVNFGAATYNFTSGELGYLGKKGNSEIENIGYGLGAISNLTDFYKYSTWDILSYEDQVKKLRRIYSDPDISYDKSLTVAGGYDDDTKIIYFGKKGLNKGMNWARSTYDHELQHRLDYKTQPKEIPSSVWGQTDYENFLDKRAWKVELDNSYKNRLSYSQHKIVYNRYVDYSRLIGVSPIPMPKYTTLQWVLSLLAR